MKTKSAPSETKKSRLDFVLKTGTVVFILIVAAKLLNFFKKILIGNLFGISWQADCFFAASYLPYEIGVFFEGVIYLGLLPVFSGIMAEKGKEAGKRFIAEMLPPVFVLAGLITLILFFVSPLLVREIVPGFALGRQYLTLDLFRVISVVIVFIALCSFFQALNSYFGNYLIAACRGGVDTLIMIGATLASYRFWGIYGAAWGAVFGAFIAFIFQALYFGRNHQVPLFKFTFRWNAFRKFMRILVPMSAIWIFQMLPLVIMNRFGSGMWQGTISALVIAQGIMVVPTALVSQTILISIFPSLARQVGEAAHAEARDTFYQILRAAFFILIPTGIALAALARPIAILFFSGGGATAEGTLRIANSLACLGWVAFAFYADLFMTQSLIAMRRILPAIGLCITRAALMYGFSYFLSSFWDYRGLALSFSLALAVNFFVLFPLFFRSTPLKGKWKSLYSYCGKLLIAVSPFIAGVFILNGISMKTWMSFSAPRIFLWIGLIAAAGAGLYFLILSWLKVKEFDSAIGSFRKFRSRRDGWIMDAGDV